jgi:hypothetical protein
MNTNNAPEQTTPEQDTDIHIYARVFPDLETRIGRAKLAGIVDPYNCGTPDATIIKSIELAGSLDLNIALFYPKADGVIVLDGFAEVMAQLISLDAMVVHVARNYQALIAMDPANIDGLERTCMERIAKLVASCGKVPSALAHNSIVDGWYVVELMGQKRFTAWISKAHVAGQPVLQLSIPTDHKHPEIRTIKYIGSRNGVYAITPCDEATALGYAHRNNPNPIERWELHRDFDGSRDEQRLLHVAPGDQVHDEDDGNDDLPTNEDANRDEQPSDLIDF